MQEYRRPPARHDRIKIPVQHPDDVINAVPAPKRLMRSRKRQPHLLIIRRLRRVIAPTIINRNRLNRHPASRRPHSVSAIKHSHQRHPPRRGPAIPFLLARDHPRSPHRDPARQPRAAYQPAAHHKLSQANGQTSRPWSPGTDHSPHSAQTHAARAQQSRSRTLPATSLSPESSSTA